MTEPTLGQKLSKCIPELDLSIVPNTVICGKCADTINALYIFKKECLQLEMQICEYIQQVHHTDNVIDLAAVMQFHQLHPKNLTAELTTEAFRKTEYKIEESTTSFCDNYAFNETEENTATEVFKKTENYKIEESTTSFCDNYVFNETDFNAFENFTNSGKLEAAEENSDTHDDSSIVQDCLLQVVEKPDSFIQNLSKTDIYYQCFTCGRKTESKLKLTRHLKSHIDKKLYLKRISSKSLCWYRCKLCNYSTKHKCLFSFHNKAHLTKKDYQCILNSRSILVNPSTNIITFAKKGCKNNTTKCESLSSNKYNFKYRGKSLSKYSESKQHSNQRNVPKLAIDNNIIVNNMLTHTNEKPFKCSVCEYSCNKKPILKRHMLTHTDEKPFKCAICEYSSKQKIHLKMHILIHIGEKRFKCSICEYRCSQTGNLKDHMLITHTSKKSLNCSVCEFICNRKSNLKRHKLMHIGEKPFKCAVCQYSSIQKNHLKRHMLTHTAEKPFLKL